jgi:hypothetical protein
MVVRCLCARACVLQKGVVLCLLVLPCLCVVVTHHGQLLRRGCCFQGRASCIRCTAVNWPLLASFSLSVSQQRCDLPPSLRVTSKLSVHRCASLCRSWTTMVTAL